MRCVVRLLKFKKPKLSFDTSSITMEANIELSEKETQSYPETCSRSLLCDGHLGTDDWDFTLFKQCETY